MKCHYLFWIVLVGIAASGASPAADVPPIAAEERDGKVLDALLTHLLTDAEFHMFVRAKVGQESVLMLNARTPADTRLLESDQLAWSANGKKWPPEAERDLRRRNTPLKSNTAKPDKHVAAEASYTKLTFGSHIIVADLTGKMNVRDLAQFEKEHPTARGWVEAYLPGYSRDAKQALVQARIGPWPHGGSTVMALLEQTGDKWIVKWRVISLTQ